MEEEAKETVGEFTGVLTALQTSEALPEDIQIRVVIVGVRQCRITRVETVIEADEKKLLIYVEE